MNDSFDPEDAHRASMAREADIGAFAHLYTDPPRPTDGPLAGLTAGIKDVIETADAPTALGSVHYRGRQTGRDAAVVTALRRAGATLIGKTTTAEFAYRDAPNTRNPLDLERTPGGSSSGSAAAVAAGMVDFALATQTGGSTIRPAAYCGVVGYKPTFGVVSTAGVMQLAASFDTVGVIARDVTTVARVAEVVAGLPPLSIPAEPPQVGVLGAATLQRCEAETLEALRLVEEAITAAGGELTEVAVDLDRLRELHGVINAYEGARSLAGDADHARPNNVELIGRGRALSVTEYIAAVRELEDLRPIVDATLAQVDVLIGPATLGWPPLGLTKTGDASYCQPWSAARVPAITVPIRPFAEKLPVGVQLVAPRWADAELLGWAGWLESVRSSPQP
ncbi:amidase [Enemella sp. A6]|uniref:amidase n=1 Tax=Enemella sp. A6 TaxID=3440152 RepID=UPI003EBD5D4C